MDDHDDSRSGWQRKLTILGIVLAVVFVVFMLIWTVFGGMWALMTFVVLVGGAGALGSEESKKTRSRRKRVEIPYPPNWDQLRRQVYQRDGHRCINCGATNVRLHAHHVVPLSRGGRNVLGNIVTVCDGCHARIHPHMRTYFR